MQRWKAITDQDVPALNKQLKNANLLELKMEAAAPRTRVVVSSKDED
jgi:hypothetical protein